MVIHILLIIVFVVLFIIGKKMSKENEAGKKVMPLPIRIGGAITLLILGLLQLYRGGFLG
jgi:hypothetical protein